VEGELEFLRQLCAACILVALAAILMGGQR
jgi:hypothetical protein